MSATRTEPAPPAVIRPDLPLAVIVAIAVTAQFMVVLDSSIVNVALPAMKTSLGLSATDQQWVVNSYLISFGGFLILAARAGDLFGRKWVFQAGLVIFTAASLVGGLAQDTGWLLGARLVQGVGAAALAPSSLSLITASHPEGPARTRALSLWAAAAASAGAVGLVLGGVLTSALSWRYVLFVNVPVGVGLLAAAALALLPSQRAGKRVRLDSPGALVVTIGIAALVYGLSEATTKGWGSAQVTVALAAAVVLLFGFVMIEARSSAPLVPLEIFGQRSLTLGNVLMAFGGIILTGSLFFLSLYCQQVLGYSALRTGLAIVPMTVLLIVGSFACRRLLPLTGARNLLLIGVLPATAGLAWLSRIPAHSAYATHVLGPTLLIGAGIGLMILPLTVLATAGMEPRFAGLASGFLNMGRQIGGAVGLAVLVTVATSQTSHDHAATRAAATVHGYHAALLICAAVSLAAGAISLLLPKPAKPGLRPAGTSA